MAKLQLSLDVLNIDDAISISEKLADYVDIISLGTPLIKGESAAESIMVMKKLFPDNLILADFKTVDAGRIEAGMAFDAGADIMAVCAAAKDMIIKEAIAISKKTRKKVMVDLIGVQDNLKRALEIDKLNPDYICMHIATDNKEYSLHEIIKIKGKIKTKLAVAGDITKKNIKEILKLSPEIIILGMALTKAKNPVSEAKLFDKLIGKKPAKSDRKSERAPFIKIIKIIEKEIKDILNKVNSKQTKKLVELLHKSIDKKIFVTGEGRSGLVGKAFATRLMHLGYKSYFIPESVVPSINSGDIFIAISGTGKNAVVLERLKFAKKQKAFATAITANSKSVIAKNSGLAIEIPAFTDSNVEPLGSLFEQSSLLYTDSIIVSLMVKFNKSPLYLRKFHPNLQED